MIPFLPLSHVATWNTFTEEYRWTLYLISVALSGILFTNTVKDIGDMNRKEKCKDSTLNMHYPVALTVFM